MQKHTDRGSEEQHSVHIVKTYQGGANLQTRSPVPPSRLFVHVDAGSVRSRQGAITDHGHAALTYRCRQLSGAVTVVAVRTLVCV